MANIGLSVIRAEHFRLLYRILTHIDIGILESLLQIVIDRIVADGAQEGHIADSRLPVRIPDETRSQAPSRKGLLLLKAFLPIRL